MRSDEELKSLTVGELKPHNAQITLCQYDPNWPVLFEREAKRIKAVLGDRALEVLHVGSTSVPGLCAKPIIDILLIVEDSADEKAYVPPMEAAGYVLRIREPEWHEHRLFKGIDTDANIHVYSKGCEEPIRMVRFRDWLRVNDNDRDKYARKKQELSQQVWRHIQHYADAKSEVVLDIMERAMAGEDKHGL